MRIITLILNIITTLINIFLIKKFFHIYQLRDYNNYRFFKFFSKKHAFCMIFLCFLLIFQIFLKNFYIFTTAQIFEILLTLYLSNHLIKPSKTPIKFTPRLMRMYFISSLILCIIIPLKTCTPISCILLTFLPPSSNLLNIYDKLKNKHYIHLAQKKLKLIKPKIIAITGSNGKTSVKNILAQLLKKRYRIQMTPSSYNTPLGISKFINNELKASTEYLILEYGARRKGDIKKLCNIFGADIGIITCVGNQHLSTFKNIENVYDAKKELADFLDTKFCAFNLDNVYTKSMYLNKHGEKQGISISSKCKICASNINIKEGKTHFVLSFNKQSTPISTTLLGEHNVTNILLAVSVAKYLKVKNQDICDAIQDLEPIPHRLELIKTNINILDDTYNCSIESARQAISVLSFFDGKKVIATPGIIEGGKEEYDINFELGRLCSKSDLMIIIGEHNKQAINSGLVSLNYDTKKILFAKTIEQSKQYFKNLNTGDTLLLLNDLPDDYL